jgi:hypothetical protein
MKHTTASLLSLAACGLTLGFLPRADAVTFAPAEGLVLQRVIEERNSRELVDVVIEVDGEEMDLEERPEFSISYEAQVVVTDELASVSDGRPTRIVRSIDEARGTRTFEGPEGSDDLETVSLLQEESVVFTWDADSEEYTAAWADEESDLGEHYLDTMHADLDLDFFLPEGEVSEGDSWEVDAADYTAIAFMSVHFGLDENEDADEEQAESLRAMLADLEDSYAGTFTCTYQGAREEDDGTTVAVIAIEGEVGTVREETFEPDLEGAPEGLTLEITKGSSYDVAYEGELLWNLEAGHMVSLELEGEMEFEEYETVNGSGPEGDFEQNRSSVFEGEAGWTVTVTPAAAG